MQQEETFEQITEDIMTHPRFLETRRFQHHGEDNSVYEHAVAVARVAHAIAVHMHLSHPEVRSVTRAALLHDFFGYDWREEPFRRLQSRYTGVRRLGHMHAFVHGTIAAHRAQRYFELTPKELNAIESHMFPLSASLPKSRIAWIVTLSDKIVAAKEMTQAVPSYASVFYRKFLA